MLDKSQFHGDNPALEEEKLRLAKGLFFGSPLTGYLTQALVLSDRIFGFLHCHVLRDDAGRFKDGSFVYTSTITEIYRENSFWFVKTLNSHYCLATTHQHDGEASIRRLLGRLKPLPFVRRTFN